MVPEFRAVVNDTETVAAQTSILQNDLSTYQEDIMAGETKETVLLFEISRDIQEISSLQLKVSMNEKKYTLNLGKNNTQ